MKSVGTGRVEGIDKPENKEMKFKVKKWRNVYEEERYIEWL